MIVVPVYTSVDSNIVEALPAADDDDDEAYGS